MLGIQRMTVIKRKQRRFSLPNGRRNTMLSTASSGSTQNVVEIPGIFRPTVEILQQFDNGGENNDGYWADAKSVH